MLHQFLTESFAADVEEFVAEAGDEVQLSCPVKTSGKNHRLLLWPGFNNFGFVFWNLSPSSVVQSQRIFFLELYEFKEIQISKYYTFNNKCLHSYGFICRVRELSFVEVVQRLNQSLCIQSYCWLQECRRYPDGQVIDDEWNEEGDDG